MKTWSKPTAGSTNTLGGATNLNDLTDVAISTPQANQVLKYDGTTFINSEVPGLASIQASFNNLNADNLTAGTINYARLPNLAGIVLSGDAVPPYIESITPITPNGNQTIEIIGEYFSPITQLSIPGVTVDSLQVRSPGKIVANISKSGLSGNKIITLANGANTNQVWADGIKSIDIFADPFWANTLLLIKGQGTISDGKNNSPITTYGNTAISTAQSKYGGASIYFDGSGDYLQLNNLSFALTGDFTLEAWVYLINTNPMVLIAGNTSGNQEFLIYSSGIWIGRTYVAWDLQLGLTTALNTWNHFAFSRSGNTLRIFRNGIQVHTMTYATTINLSPVLIGRDPSGTRQSAGYLSHLRWANVARYTANFSAETDTYLNT